MEGFTITCNRCGSIEVMMDVDLDTGIMTVTCEFCHQTIDIENEQEDEEDDDGLFW